MSLAEQSSHFFALQDNLEKLREATEKGSFQEALGFVRGVNSAMSELIAAL